MGDNLPIVDVGTNRIAKQIACGERHTCVLLDNNEVKCWGRNYDGELGLGTWGIKGLEPSTMGDNLPVLKLGTEVNVVPDFIACGSQHSCVLINDATVKCWGVN